MSALPITLVIPFYNEALALPSFLSQMEEQFLKLEEVLFVDSGSNDGGAELINNFRNSHKSKLNIKVLKVDSKDKNGKEKIALPGESRNIGIKEAGTPWIAFLDLGIAVDANWLTTMWQLVQKRPESGALGKCLFYGRDSFTKALCALTNGVGQAGTTLPGALINRKVFSEIGFFPEYLRSAEDLVWREKFTESYGELTPEKAVISYSTYPENIIQVLKKWFTYSKNTVWAGVSLKQVMVYIIYFSALLLIIAINHKIAIIIIFLHYLGRGIIDPIRRSKSPLWFKTDLFAPILALNLVLWIDLTKYLGFLYGFITFRKS